MEYFYLVKSNPPQTLPALSQPPFLSPLHVWTLTCTPPLSSSPVVHFLATTGLFLLCLRFPFIQQSHYEPVRGYNRQRELTVPWANNRAVTPGDV